VTAVTTSPLPDIGAVRRALSAALETERAEVRRLSYARTSVCFRVAGHGSVALQLDRRPPVLLAGSEPSAPEIVIDLTPEQAAAFAGGALALPEAVCAGEVSASGPVRRFLEVEPILRKLLAGANPELASTPGPISVGPCPAIDPELLAIETRGVRKAFGDQEVLRGASIQVPAGVISCILGPSGTGKSVLLKHLIGLLRPDAGEILIRGRRLSRMSRSELVSLRSEIGVMFQDGALFSTMNLFDNVAFPLRQHSDLQEHEIREVVEDRLAAVGLLAAANRLPAQLSGGMKKRAGLARALVLDPGIVLCDEPDSGLDPVRTALLADLLMEQHARFGGTMLVITHNIALARQISDHVSVLWKGEVVESGPFAHLTTCNTALVRQFLAGESHGPLGMD
jgi:phospholipid/cholesterol/gamma-HCH transport system ATP-binding protein